MINTTQVDRECVQPTIQLLTHRNMSPHGRMVINNDQLLYLPDSKYKIHLYLEEFNTWHIFESDIPPCMISVDEGKTIIDGNPDSDSSGTHSIVASDGQLYQLQTDGAVWVYDASAGKWETLDPRSQQKRCIAADNSNLYQLRANGEVWRYNGPRVKGWSVIDSNGENISLVAGAREVYVKHHDGAIYQFQGGKQAWNRIERNMKTLQIAVWRAGLFQRQEDKIYKYHASTGFGPSF
ncbi:hypothetical protein D9619_000288 [Psilocybe cf. subviscida]|uniref:Uncharacterized protein n=1 Tax=Psilocybe cf. subviscida TaxID=2480587 RepID=A0A8H5F2W3_9AGAR|nr:hypothetical protein D9619_000288 [Psilocybe cf. subviscida]